MSGELCPVCGRRFTPRKRGARQRFCCESHRQLFHSVVAEFGAVEMKRQDLTFPDLRRLLGR